MDIGGEVLLRCIPSLLFAALAAWVCTHHRRRLVISTLVLFAGLSVAFWPAVDVWAAVEGPVLSLDFSREVTMAWWGGNVARSLFCFGPLGLAVWLYFFGNDY